MKDNFDLINKDLSPSSYSNADGKFLLWVENLFGVGTGRRKACSEAGLSGAGKRACAKQLKSTGWKKGQPIPSDMAGITLQDVVASEQPASTQTYPPLPTESYVSPYQATSQTATTTEEDGIITTTYPQTPSSLYPPKATANNGLPNLDVPDKFMGMNSTQQIIAVVGTAGLITLAVFGVRKVMKNRNKFKLTPALQ